jgi:diguanylate cyclase (GGDEF)-like protein/PAS domain S-box-containing protein
MTALLDARFSLNLFFGLVVAVTLSVGARRLFQRYVEARWQGLRLLCWPMLGLLLLLGAVGVFQFLSLPTFLMLVILVLSTVLAVLMRKQGNTMRAAEGDFRQSEAHWPNLLRDVPNVAVRAYGRDGIVTYWNRGATALYGYTVQEAIGSRITDLIVPEAAKPGALHTIEQMFESQRVIPPKDYLFHNKQAVEVCAYCSHTYLSRVGHAPEIISFDIDMSERNNVQTELRVAAVAFESPESMLVMDPQLQVLRINQAFTVRLGYTLDQVVGQALAGLSAEGTDSIFHEELYQLLLLQGQWSGEIWLHHQGGGLFPEWLNINAVKNKQDEVTHFVATLSSLTQRKVDEEKIRQLAYFDPLTELPNRRLLMDRMRQALHNSHLSHAWGAVLLIDLDRFKTLNDTQGHGKGDLLLQLVAKRLGQLLKPTDTVARMGGDEFVVLLENLDRQAEQANHQAQAVGQRIMKTLCRSFGLEDTHFYLSCSVGISLFKGNDCSTDELLSQADLAMYQVKANGRNGLRVFDQPMQFFLNARTDMTTHIRQAVEQKQFVLHYQPQVNALGQVTGAEALLRWQHPVRGEILPRKFISIAEETGQIVAMGDWVLQKVCRQLQLWSGNPLIDGLTVSANVSTHQFCEPDFADKLLRLLDATGADPKRLKLELTESVMVDNLDDIAQKMQRLKKIGVSFSLDDFGTGYSSLAYLKKLPIDELKIDRSFVRDILTNSNDAAIARTIVTLSHSLGLEVIAEGVETEQQREMLAWYNCFSYQGYLFSRPLPLLEFEQYVADLQSKRDSV